MGFEVYTGKTTTQCAANAEVLDPDCNQTTRIVMGLMQKARLLDKGHHVYMDNYYSSPYLYKELHYRSTFACGTCHPNRKYLPKAVTKVKFKKKSDCIFRRKGPLLCLKWGEKKDVTMLSTIHEAVFLETGKVDRNGDKIEKPEPVYYYCGRMGRVDLSDQLLNYYSFLRKSSKWSRKLLIHLSNLVLLNAYILNKRFCCQILTHDEYWDKIVKFLLDEGLKCYKIPLPPVISQRIARRNTEEEEKKHLTERHFITNVPAGEGRKRKKPTRCCFVCSKMEGLGGVHLKEKRTSFWCEDCRKPLCITPCFKIYHTEVDYKEEGRKYRVGENYLMNGGNLVSNNGNA